MPTEKGKEDGGGRFLDLASTGPERLAVKPVPCGGTGPASGGRSIFINRVRYAPVSVNGARHIPGISNGKAEEVLLVSSTLESSGFKPFS